MSTARTTCFLKSSKSGPSISESVRACSFESTACRRNITTSGKGLPSPRKRPIAQPSLRVGCAIVPKFAAAYCRASLRSSRPAVNARNGIKVALRQVLLGQSEKNVDVWCGLRDRLLGEELSRRRQSRHQFQERLLVGAGDNLSVELVLAGDHLRFVSRAFLLQVGDDLRMVLGNVVLLRGITVEV